ncbi:MAG: SDR family oxidoreductase [Clostridiales bacterium]|nr:SDR family oxidoreductase [Clostridiales bacterium]
MLYSYSENQQRKKKNALVTGASGVIGRECALELARECGFIVLNYCSDKKGAEDTLRACREIGCEGICVQADISDYAQAQMLFNEAQRACGGIDIAVLNAGVSLNKLVYDTTVEEFSRVISVNLTGVFNTAKLASEQMLSRGWGRIIAVSSMWAKCGAACEAAYAASKGGVEAFVKSLAKELAASSITVNCVAPGAVATPMTLSLGEETVSLLTEDIPQRRLCEPQEVAHAVLFLASEKAAYITGAVLAVNGGLVT